MKGCSEVSQRVLGSGRPARGSRDQLEALRVKPKGQEASYRVSEASQRVLGSGMPARGSRGQSEGLRG